MRRDEVALPNGTTTIRETIGHACDRLVRLGSIHPCIGYSDEQIMVYLATELQRAGTDRAGGEFLEPFDLSLDEALDWVRQGKITDVKTIVALYWAERHLKGEWNPSL